MAATTHGVRSRGRSKDQDAHASAVRIDFTDVAKFLSENLGGRLTAYIAGVDVKTVQRWIAGGPGSPRDTSEQRLRAAFQVFQLLQTVESPHTVRVWFMGMNPQLDDASPAEALSEDRQREVMAAARAFIQGG